MTHEFWQERWATQQTGWHEARAHRLLVEFGDRLRASSARLGGERPRVLVPLCGKSHDLTWLRDQGFSVTGVDLVRLAAEAYFRENGLEPEVASAPGFERWISPHLEIRVGDFMELRPEPAARFEAAYDRAALVAIAPEDRTRYVATLLGALAPGAPILLITFDYEDGQMSGPPFRISEGEVRALFSACAQIELLRSDDILESEPRFKERGLSSLRETAWWMVSTHR